MDKLISQVLIGIGFALVLVLALIAVNGKFWQIQTPPVTPTPTPSGIIDGMPNPASVYCKDLGYTSEGSNCKFTDGTTCEEWAFYRGTCGHAFSYCEKQGHVLSNVIETTNSTTYEYALCTFADGTMCKEQDYKAGTCKTGQCKEWTLVAGCVNKTGLDGPIGGNFGMVNPASKYCDDLGYILNGENCEFPDGTICDQWAFYDAECGNEFSYCEKQGYTVQTRSEDVGGWVDIYPVCIFDDGSECLEQDYFAGKCAKGQCSAWNMSDNGCKPK